MKKRKILQTLAMALSIVSVSALAPVENQIVNKLLYSVGIETQEASAATTTVTSGGFTFVIDDVTNTATVTTTTNTGAIAIPDNINGVPVTYIGYNAFMSKTTITSVVIPKSVTSIGGNAFYGCTGLTTIDLTNFVGSIGYDAFYNCAFLASSLYTENNIKYLIAGTNVYAYSYVTAPTGNYTMPSTVNNGVYSVIGIAGAFYNCTGLTSIVIPNSVTSIGVQAFYGCTSLTSIVIPNSVTSVGAYAFQNCTSLKTLTLPNNVKTWDTTWMTGDTSLTYVKMSSESLIASTVLGTMVKAYFMDEDEQTYVGAFMCKLGTSLSSLQPIPTKPGYTFSKWGKSSSTQTSVVGNIQDNVTFIASYTSGSITVADPTLSLSTDTADNRDTSVTATLSNTVVGNSYYYTTDGTVPTTSNGTLIAGNTFNIPVQNLDTEKVITVNVVGTKSGVYSNIASSIVTFAAKQAVITDPTIVLDGITYSTDSENNVTVQSAVGKTGSILIPNIVNGNPVKYIATQAFKNCKGITNILMPNTITSIGAYAFQDCTGLTTVTMSTGVTSLLGGTFLGCTGLTNISLTESIVLMTSSEFTNCTNLKTIKANSEIVNSTTLTGYNKVSYMSDDEATTLASYYVKTGVSMVGKEIAPIIANYTFSKWTRYTPVSISTLSNIQDNVTFMAVYNSTPGTAGPLTLKVSNPLLTQSKTSPINRESGITVKVS